MIDFITYIQLIESTDMALSPEQKKLQGKITKLSYTKTKFDTNTRFIVYGAKSEREAILDNISSKIKYADLVKSTKYSSIGHIEFKSGPFKKYTIVVKPDASKSINTDEQETLAGIYIACKQNNKNTSFSFEDLQQFGDPLVDSKYKIKDIYEKAGKGWLASSELVANTITKYIDGIYRVQQRSGSKFEKSISDAAKKLIALSGAKMDLNKWNPADIWLVKSQYVNYDFSKFSSIIELNEFIAEKFKSKEIIGVSLKMLGKSAKVETFNLDKQDKPIEFLSLDLGKTGFVKTIDGTIYFTNGSLSIRNFGRPENVNADIDGAHAKGGKVGFGPLISILRKQDPKMSVPPLKNNKEILILFKKNPDTVLKHLYDQMKILDPRSAAKYSYAAYKDETLKRKNLENYIVSKWQVSDIMSSIKRMPKAKQNQFIKDVIAYASSSTEISSVYYKIS